jgi:hypothetical protein
MYGLSIGFSHNPQILTHILSQGPATNAPIRLHLCTEGICQHRFDPFPFEIWATGHYTCGEVRSCLHPLSFISSTLGSR